VILGGVWDGCGKGVFGGEGVGVGLGVGDGNEGIMDWRKRGIRLWD